MPKVERCRVTECCYNLSEMCHALAITVGGDGDHPACDTYCDYRTKGGDRIDGRRGRGLQGQLVPVQSEPRVHGPGHHRGSGPG